MTSLMDGDWWVRPPEGRRRRRRKEKKKKKKKGEGDEGQVGGASGRCQSAAIGRGRRIQLGAPIRDQIMYRFIYVSARIV